MEETHTATRSSKSNGSVPAAFIKVGFLEYVLWTRAWASFSPPFAHLPLATFCEDGVILTHQQGYCYFKKSSNLLRSMS